MKKNSSLWESSRQASKSPKWKGNALTTTQLLPNDHIESSFQKSCLLIAARLTYTRVFFLGKCLRGTAAKTMVVDRKYLKAPALLCLTSEPLWNAANSSDVLRLDSMLRVLGKLRHCDKQGCFPGKMCSDCFKTHRCGQKKNRRH